MPPSRRDDALSFANQLIGWMAICSFLFVLLLTASPQLHEAFHGGEAGGATHQCVVVTLSKGGCLADPPVTFLPAPLLISEMRAHVPAPVFLSTEGRLSPSRAPPLPPV